MTCSLSWWFIVILVGIDEMYVYNMVIRLLLWIVQSKEQPQEAHYVHTLYNKPLSLP